MSSTKQQFVKNTNTPDQDSILWQLGNNWRISAKTGDCYCPLKYSEEKEISDLQLFTTMVELLKKPVTELDYVEYSGMYFVPTKTGEGDSLLFAYAEEQPAKDKVTNIKKFANSQQSTTAPKTTTAATAPKQTTAAKGTHIDNTVVQSFDEIKEHVFLKQDHMPVFTDPQWIDAGSETARELEKNGYNYIPRSLAETNFRVENVYDGEKIVGERYLFLMGRIINVRISDK